jgi:hypothetical protein
MILDMCLRGFTCVMTRMSVVTVRQMGMVPGRFVPSSLVVLRSFPVMTCCVLVMFSCLMMMLCRSLRHSLSLFCL